MLNDFAQEGQSLTVSSGSQGTTDCSWERRFRGSDGTPLRSRSRRTRSCSVILLRSSRFFLSPWKNAVWSTAPDMVA